MAAAADGANNNILSETMMMKGEEAVERLRSAEASSYMSPSVELSRLARDAARHLYASLVPLCPPGTQPPLERLLADEGLYDAEQVWSQIDLLLSRPILPLLRRHIKKLMHKQQQQQQEKQQLKKEEEEVVEEQNAEELENDDEDKEEILVGEGDDDEDDEELDEEQEEESDEGDDEEEAIGVEDKFLKIRELEDFLERGEEEEYGIAPEKKKNNNKRNNEEEDDEDEDDEEEEVGFPFFSFPSCITIFLFSLVSQFML